MLAAACRLCLVVVGSSLCVVGRWSLSFVFAVYVADCCLIVADRCSVCVAV